MDRFGAAQFCLSKKLNKQVLVVESSGTPQYFYYYKTKTSETNAAGETTDYYEGILCR